MNHTLYNAVAALTWHCDGARSRDAQGFSKADAAWGALLSRGSEAGWHPSWPRAAWEMLRKYRKQLAGYGIVYEAIPEPPQSGAPFERLPVFRSVTVSNGGLRFHFPYSPQIGVKLRDAGCKWDMMGKVWWVLPSPENVQAILDVARQFEFAVSPEALALLNSPPAGRPTSEKKASPAMPREIVQASPGLYKIMFEYDSRLVAEVKALPGRRYHAGDERFWTAPLSAELASFAYANLFIGAEPIAVALAERDCLHDLNRAESKADSAEVDTSGLGGELRPFQRVGVRYALRNERVFIADEMGLGKTVQALAAVHAAKAFPALIVCPASLKHNWKRESEKWLPGREVVVLNGQKRGGSLSGPPFGGGGEVVVVNYDLLKRWADELMTRQFKAVIFDESHYCLDGDTKVVTDLGELPIREIVTGRLPVSVLCYDSLSNAHEWKPVTGWFQNEQSQIKVRVRTTNGEIVCTANHKFWTANGYAEAGSLTSGTQLRAVPEIFSSSQAGKEHLPLLLQAVRGDCNQCPPRSESENQQSLAQALDRKILRMVQGGFSHSRTGQGVRQPQILRRVLRRALANDVAGAQGVVTASYQAGTGEDYWQPATRCVDSDESQQSDERSCRGRKNAAKADRSDLPVTRREWAADKAATIAGEPTESAHGVRYLDAPGQGAVSFLADLLQGRFGDTGSENSRRGGRGLTQDEEVDIPGPAQNGDSGCAWVESVEVYQPGSLNGNRESGSGDQFVYDLEVADNHNFFANGVLVSNCKNSKALRTQRARALAKGVKYRFCLTGTPVLNRPVELLSQLALIDRLEEMGGFWSFAKRYCNAYRSKFGWDLSGAANLEELNRLLRERCFIRRNKADVLTELPAKQRSVLPVEISNRKDYETASSDLLFYLGERAANDEAFLQEIAHLSPQKRSQAKWARASTAQYKAEAAEALVRVETLKQVAAQGKLEAVTEWAESFLESDQKLVLFASHIAIQKALIERFPGCASILGEYDSQLRQDNVDRFQNDPRCRLIVCSLQAAAEGITLTAASNVAFVELGWNPGRMSQAEDRVHRIGQRDNVTCYYLLAKDTIDEEIYGLIERKREVVDALTEGDDPTDANKGILSELLARLREKKG